VKLNLATFFTWTGAGLIVVAAGVLAYAVHDLQEGQVIGGLNTLAFDVSATIPPGSWYATLLRGIFNFTPQTTVAQAIAWVAYIVPVMALFFLSGRGAKAPKPASTPSGGAEASLPSRA
jgi:high-affinity iron transporter